MVKHASSHGFAVLVCTVASAFLVELLRPHIPHAINGMHKFTSSVIDISKIPLSPEVFSIVVIASLLAMVWGVFFKIRNK